MKVKEVFVQACAWLGLTARACMDIEVFVPYWLDALCVEALPYENARRKKEGLPVLQEAGRLRTQEDDIPFREDICRTALVYGLLAEMLADDEDHYRAAEFRNRFVTALEEAQRLGEERVVDLYA